MYHNNDNLIENITIELPQFFPAEKEAESSEEMFLTEQKAAISQLLDTWIEEFEELHMEAVQRGDVCQRHESNELVEKQSSI